MSTTSVHIKEAFLITPSEPTPSQILHLSALDSQIFLRFTVEYLLVYRPRHGLDKSLIIGHVKSALGRALVPYYPLAGRVRARDDRLGLEVVCRAQGAVLVEAASDHIVSTFERAPLCVSEWRNLLERNLLKLQVANVLNGAPLLVVQMTWLSDGGVALGVGFSHCICDGIGSADFLNLFADLATGLRGVDDFKPRPVWDRHLLETVSLGIPQHDLLSQHYEFHNVPDVCRFASRFSHDQLTPTSFTFDKMCLDELKQAALLSQQSAQYTSFDVLSAHIWRSWARALNLPSTQILKLLFSVNIRNRVKPSLPSGYYGNAFVLGCAQSTVMDLNEKGLNYATQLIKAAKDLVDDKYVREVVELVSESGMCPDSVGVLILSQWSRVGLERVDFGMGRPVQVGPVCTDKYCILLPIHDQREGVKVMLAVPTIAAENYMNLLKTTCSKSVLD